jgi:hypothetical protein
MIPIAECRGCYDDFYNGPRGQNGRCWMASDGKMMTRYAIHYMTRPTEPGAFTKVKRPSCYHQVNNLMFVNTLPEHAVKPRAERRKRDSS